MRHLRMRTDRNGLMAATPLLAQTAGAATGGAMQKAAPSATAAPGDDGRSPHCRETGRPCSTQSATEAQLTTLPELPRRVRSDHQGPALQGQGRVADKKILPENVYNDVRTRSSPSRKS